MRKAIPHKIGVLKSPDSINSHSNLAATLKSIVSNEPISDKKPADPMGTSLQKTGLTRHDSTGKLTKFTSNTTNVSVSSEDQSVRTLRKLIRQELAKETRPPFKSKVSTREQFRDAMLDSIVQLKKEVAQIREGMKLIDSTGLSADRRQVRKATSCTSFWQAGCSNSKIEPTPSTSTHFLSSQSINKSQLERRLDRHEQIFGQQLNSLKIEMRNKCWQLEIDSSNRGRQTSQRVFQLQAQNMALQNEIQRLRNAVEIQKRQKISRLQQNYQFLTGRVDSIQGLGLKGYQRKQSGSFKFDFGKETEELRKEIGDMKLEIKNMDRFVSKVGQNSDRLENQLKETIAKVESRLGIRNLADKVGDLQHNMNLHTQYFENFDCKIAKAGRQAEDTLYKLIQLQTKFELQQPKKHQCQVTTADFRETLETLQTQTDNKLIKIVSEYNDNFMMIDQSICELRDFVQDVIDINKNINQKLQAVWRYQVSEREHLEEIYKTNDDVYTLLQNNIQKVSQLTKKEMSFEHQFKQLRQRMTGVVDVPNRCRRVGSFNASFSDMKSRLINDIKQNHLPFDRRGPIAANHVPMSLMDENIQDQSGQFE